ncbi:Hok/Gef family protein [Mixta sp. Marseille-Q2057]|nr:Hok/Gef family protein [Mixta mediterraneensis]
MMPQKLAVTALIVICVTLLVFTWLTRKSLCEIHIRNGDTEVAAFMAYESVR